MLEPLLRLAERDAGGLALYELLAGGHPIEALERNIFAVGLQAVGEALEEERQHTRVLAVELGSGDVAAGFEKPPGRAAQRWLDAPAPRQLHISSVPAAGLVRALRDLLECVDASPSLAALPVLEGLAPTERIGDAVEVMESVELAVGKVAHLLRNSRGKLSPPSYGDGLGAPIVLLALDCELGVVEPRLRRDGPRRLYEQREQLVIKTPKPPSKLVHELVAGPDQRFMLINEGLRFTDEPIESFAVCRHGHPPM